MSRRRRGAAVAAALPCAAALLGCPGAYAEDQTDAAADAAVSRLVDGAADADAADATDQTAERERLAIIPTIYGDLRRVGAYCEPALAPEAPSGALDWSIARTAVAWAADSPPAAEGLAAGAPVPVRVERRSDARLRWEQGMGAGMLLLATAAAARDDRTRAAHLGDPQLMVQAPLWRSRYAACALALGGEAPLGGASARDWLGDHGSVRGGGWSGRAALAGCGGIGLVAIQARLAADATPRGANAVRAADGSTTTIHHRTGAVEAALAATWRAATWLRAGAEADAWQRRWRARLGDSLGPTQRTLRVEACDCVLMAELTPLSGWSLRADAGVEAAQALRARDRVVAGSGLDWTW